GRPRHGRHVLSPTDRSGAGRRLVPGGAPAVTTEPPGLSAGRFFFAVVFTAPPVASLDPASGAPARRDTRAVSGRHEGAKWRIGALDDLLSLEDLAHGHGKAGEHLLTVENICPGQEARRRSHQLRFAPRAWRLAPFRDPPARPSARRQRDNRRPVRASRGEDRKETGSRWQDRAPLRSTDPRPGPRPVPGGRRQHPERAACRESGTG